SLCLLVLTVHAAMALLFAHPAAYAIG
ncbi:MAG: hypothetical protein JWP15_205, partial [Alphaproteobacteria bacterium]|nr:hypothetical protein [Alphaproteobacteria bacterium]